MSEKPKEVREALSEAAAVIATAVNHWPDPKGPECARTALVATIGRFLESIDDRRWLAIMDCAGEPCGTPDCQCHIGTQNVLRALDEYRDETKDMLRSGAKII